MGTSHRASRGRRTGALRIIVEVVELFIEFFDVGMVHLDKIQLKHL